MTPALTESAGALRAFVPEDDWIPLTAGLRDLGLPEFLVPSLDAVAPFAAARGFDPASTAAFEALDAVTRQALRLPADAVLRIELQTVIAGRGASGLFWTDGHAAASLVRRLRVVDAGVAFLPGVDVSAFEVTHLVPEVLRHLRFPDAPPPAAVELPDEMAVGIAEALAGGRPDAAAVLAEKAGLADVPEVLAALARGIDGDLTLGVMGPAGLIAGRWLHCDAGWVELRHDRPGLLNHLPAGEDEIAARLTFALTAHLDAALTPRERP